MKPIIVFDNYRITFSHDEDTLDPNQCESDEVFLIHEHRNFYVSRKGFDMEEIMEDAVLDEDKKILTYNGYYLFTVFAYIHSGVALSLSGDSYPFNDRFDSSRSGVLLVKINAFPNINEARVIAEGEIKQWNQYLRGDVYRFEVERLTRCKSCNTVEAEFIDSCGGFYGEVDEKSEIYIEAMQSVLFDIEQRKRDKKSLLQKIIHWIRTKLRRG
jgi:hypothetical protein